MCSIQKDFDSFEQMLEMYFSEASPPRFERRAIEHPARADAFPDKDRNSLGYRSDEFSERGDLNLAFVGCSWTEGEGVARGSIYPDVVKRILAKKLNTQVRAWNFGQSASGIDYASRILPSVIGLRPDCIVLVFSGPDRREYFSADGRRMLYSNGLSKLIENNPENTDVDLACSKPIMMGFGALKSKHQDLANYALHARAIAAMLNFAGLPWLYTCVDAPSATQMMALCQKAGILSQSNYLGQAFQKVDVASDTNPHPGAESHKAFSELVASAILQGQGQPLLSPGAASPRKQMHRRWWQLFSGFKKKNGPDRGRIKTNDDDDVYPLW